MNWEQIAEACGFLSTLSLRRATMWTVPGPPLFLIFLSTLSLRRATQDCRKIAVCNLISIHALLAESDGQAQAAIIAFRQFLSTLSLRRATVPPFLKFPSVGDFYPRSPCGERRRHSFSSCIPNISIHALLAESDGRHSVYYQAMQGFLSTLSLRRATFNACCTKPIHTFLSTLSLRRATMFPCFIIIYIKFLSTLSLRRATIRPCRFLLSTKYFYPRSPCGERPMGLDGRFKL